MSEHQHDIITRRCDVAVVGGSAAGLAAALQILRQDRSVIVLDGGEPRNAPAAHMHGYLGYEGAAPADLAAAGRAEVRRYGGEILDGRVDRVDRDADDFVVEAGGVSVRARRVVAATGVIDELPTIDGLAERWGREVIHCPFCHGYEVRGRRLVQIVDHPVGLHPTRLLTHLTDRLTLVVEPDLDVAAEDLVELAAAGATVLRDGVRRLAASEVEPSDPTPAEGNAPVVVELDDGRRLPADAVVVTPRVRPRIEPFHPLGLTAASHPIGVATVVTTDATGQTGIAGLYAAGNVADPSQQVLAAAADGSRVGAMVAVDLATEDQAVGRRGSANAIEWEARYAGDEIWSGAPNGTLVDEVASTEPGRALDVGAGEGGDALWLAERGWMVTATDITGSGLDHLAARAAAQDLDLRCLPTDANGWRAYGDDTYDLVSLCYSAIPRTGDDRAIENLLDAVAPGGTLLMVGHAPPEPAAATAAAATPTGGIDRPSPWDRHAFVGIDAVEQAIRARPDWTIVTSERRHRPPGSATHHHHDQDLVLRACRDGAPSSAR